MFFQSIFTNIMCVCADMKNIWMKIFLNNQHLDSCVRFSILCNFFVALKMNGIFRASSNIHKIITNETGRKERVSSTNRDRIFFTHSFFQFSLHEWFYSSENRIEINRLVNNVKGAETQRK